VSPQHVATTAAEAIHSTTNRTTSVIDVAPAYSGDHSAALRLTRLIGVFALLLSPSMQMPG